MTARLPKSSGRRLPGTPEPMHRWLGADGVVLAGDACGDPDRPLVVLQHGGGQTQHAWKGAGERLAGTGPRASSPVFVISVHASRA
ncbi:MAG: pimeloyl-ACP methyl ester carboxylesterase [Burkholderiaceae bacterium]